LKIHQWCILSYRLRILELPDEQESELKKDGEVKRSRTVDLIVRTFLRELRRVMRGRGGIWQEEEEEEAEVRKRLRRNGKKLDWSKIENRNR
jgi:hypothetical protein